MLINHSNPNDTQPQAAGNACIYTPEANIIHPPGPVASITPTDPSVVFISESLTISTVQLTNRAGGDHSRDSGSQDVHSELS